MWFTVLILERGKKCLFAYLYTRLAFCNIFKRIFLSFDGNQYHTIRKPGSAWKNSQPSAG